jgi:hypothetical protein
VPSSTEICGSKFSKRIKACLKPRLDQLQT